MKRKNRRQVGKIKGDIMGVHFRNVNDVLAILRDVYTYIAIQNRQDKLGKKLMDRIEPVLRDNDNLSGDNNENKRNSEN